MGEIRRNFVASFKKNTILLENIASLSVLQTLNYFIPLITFPYIVRILGPEKYGLISFAQAFITYFILIIDYGFKFSATRDIAINKGNRQKISSIFCSVYVIKLILFLFSTVFFSLIISFIPRFSSEKLVFIFSFLAVLGNLAFPVWFFQGMEKMRYITIINVLVKTAFMLPIFLFIKDQSDYIYVPLINSSGILISGIIALLFAIKNFKIRLSFPTKKLIAVQFKKGWHAFVSTIFISFYTNSNTFILGFLADNEVVGYFAGAERIIKVFRSLLAPVSQAVYPHLSRLFKNSQKISLKVFKKIAILTGSFSLAISIIIFALAPQLIKILLGNNFYRSLFPLRIMAPLVLIINMSNVFGLQGLFAFGNSSKASRVFVIASLFHTPCFIILTKLFSINGSALAVVLTETLVTTLCFIYLNNFLKGKYEKI